MILVGTNVISELWRIAPDPGVLAWVDAQAIETALRVRARSAVEAGLMFEHRGVTVSQVSAD
jgi:predicted nucleic acid-binding protein